MWKRLVVLRSLFGRLLTGACNMGTSSDDDGQQVVYISVLIDKASIVCARVTANRLISVIVIGYQFNIKYFVCRLPLRHCPTIIHVTWLASSYVFNII